MVEYGKDGIEYVREQIATAARRNGLEDQAKNFLPKSLSFRKQQIRANLFLGLGINCVGQSLTIRDANRFITLGCNRFFRSIANRKMLTNEVLKSNSEKGMFLIAMDWYIANVLFDVDTITDEVIDEWNEMISTIRIRKGHGVKIARITNEESGVDQVKYMAVERLFKD